MVKMGATSVWRVAVVTGVVTALLLVTEVRCHGRLLLPPSRASMWRLGYDNPPNFNDNQLFCGGRDVSVRVCEVCVRVRYACV